MDGAETSWDEWIQALISGQDETVYEFWKDYGPRLQAVASKNLSLNLRRRAEPDDIVQSACRTFFRRAQAGQFQLDDSEQLWRLLYAITLTKTRQYARFHSRKKRGVNQERNINQQGEDGRPAIDAVANDPTPEEAAQFSEILAQLFSALDEEQQRIVEMKLEHFTNDEIAVKLRCSERTVRRISKRIRGCNESCPTRPRKHKRSTALSDSIASFPIDESTRRRFETAWLTGKPQQIENVLPPPDSATHLGTLAELIQIEMEFHWKETQTQRRETSHSDVNLPPTINEYLERFPQLDDATLRRRLIQQEYLLRYKYGDSPGVAEYQQRFPELSLDTRAVQSEFFPLQPESFSVSVPSVTASGLTAKSIEQLPQEIGTYQRRGTRFTDRIGLLCDAYDTHIDDEVVMRIIDPRLLNGMTVEQVAQWRILLEATANRTSRLRHAHIAQVLVSNHDSDVPFYVLNLPGSVPLTQILESHTIEPRAAVGYLNQIAQAIDTIHAADQIQGYITPWNILIDTHRNRALLIDVGIDPLLESLERDSSDAAVHPAFRSPEQLNGQSTAKQCDVYCLGAVLYHMLTGRPPFMANDDEETKRQALNYEPIPPNLLNLQVDRSLSDLCMKCLAKPRQQRFASAKLLTDALSAWAADAKKDQIDLAAQPAELAEKQPRSLVRSWDRWLGWLLALLLAIWLVWSRIGGKQHQRRLKAAFVESPRWK